MKTRLFSAVFLMWNMLISSSRTSDHHLSKRSFYLLFPRNSVFQFTYGLTVPYVLPRRSINLTWGFQAQYNYPYNISNFFPKTIAVRSGTSGFDLQKITFYDYLAKTLDNFGLNGEQCVLRSVCEVAEIPMYDKEGSVLEKIVEYLFTPSFEVTANETKRALDNQNDDLWAKLLRAEKRGKTKGNCDEEYSQCLLSIVDLMTVLYVT
ncbi:uncharacterized protein [Euwallacea similis]|uniref:uncharacterized protein n=1 Tax=Euwallacea similis TaxID=1736056 RepID=UPI00344E6F22